MNDGYRDYEAPTGRWKSRDPIEEMGGLNLYGFVRNDGVSTLDRLGLDMVYPGLPSGIADGPRVSVHGAHIANVKLETHGDASPSSIIYHTAKNILNSVGGFRYNEQAADYFTDISNIGLNSHLINLNQGTLIEAKPLFEQYPEIVRALKSKGQAKVDHDVLWFSSKRALTIGHIYIHLDGQILCDSISGNLLKWKFKGKASAKPDKFDFNQMKRIGVTEDFDLGMWFWNTVQGHTSGWFYIKPEGVQELEYEGFLNILK